MDKLTALNLSFDKILIQIFIPGLLCMFPWILYYLEFHSNAKKYLYANPSALVTVLTIISTIAGLLLDNASSLFEYYIIDKKIKKTDQTFSDTWDKYLQLSFTQEPIGQRYIRNILNFMKFELSTGIALIPMSAGLIFLNLEHRIFQSQLLFVILTIAVPVLISTYLLFVEAVSSGEVLAKTRKLLVDKYYPKI